VSGYESQLRDIAYLFDVASETDRAKVAKMVCAVAKRDGNCHRFFDEAGQELSLDEIHRRTQANPAIQRSVYNLWMTYAR
jgi:hypothetical protein